MPSWSEDCFSAVRKPLPSLLDDLYASSGILVGILRVRCAPAVFADRPRAACFLLRDRPRERVSLCDVAAAQRRRAAEWLESLWLVHGDVVLRQRGGRNRVWVQDAPA